MKTVVTILLGLACLTFVPVSVGAVELPDKITIGGLEGIDPHDSDSTYEIGLALSGGGARGLSAIGILKAFEEKEIKVVGITGTSIGGVVGGLYACGYTPGQMDSIISHLNFSELFSNRPARTTMLLTQREARERHLLAVRFDGFRPKIPHGLTTGQELSAIISRLTSKQVYLAGGNFEKLPIPFRTVCTDIVSGEKILLNYGSMADAIRSTIAFPLAFTGVEHGERLLMDGGMVSPVPVDDLIELVEPQTFIVAINSTSPLADKDHLNTPVDIATQVTTIMTQDRLNAQLALADHVVVPEIGSATLTDINHASKFVAEGYLTGLKEAEIIIAKIRSREAASRFTVATVEPISNLINHEPTSRAVMMLSERLNGRSTSLREIKSFGRAVCRELDLFSLEIEFASNDSSTPLVNLFLVTTENPIRAEIEIILSGNESIASSTLFEAFHSASDQLSPPEIKAGLDRMIDLYHSRGFDLARARKIDLDHTSPTLTIEIDEGIIARIEVLENKISKDWLLRSYLPMKVGEPWKLDKAAEGIDNIYGSDLFERVTLDLTPSDSGAIVTIEVEEKKYTQVRLGWHWNDFYQSEEFVELLNDNLFGTGAEYLLHSALGYDRQNYYFQLRANRIFSTYFTGRTRLYYDRIERSIYDNSLNLVGVRDERRWGASFKIGRHYSRLGTLSVELVLEELEYRDSRNDTKRRFGLRTLVLESLVETFDRTTFPETGKKHLFQLSFYGETMGGELTVFSRYYNSIESYFPLGQDVNYHPKIILGFSRTGLPASEKFFLGGMKSFSGYHEHQQTGDKIFAFNQELRFRLPWRFYLTGRYDIGDLYQSADEVKLSDLQQGWGGSIAFDSPIGPFEFGYGKARDGPELYYFYAGFEF